MPQPNDTDFTDKLHHAQSGNKLLVAPRASRKVRTETFLDQIRRFWTRFGAQAHVATH